MPDTRRITMRHIKDILRLKLEVKQSHQQIANSLGISKGVVTKYVKLADTAGLQWEQIQNMDETALRQRLVGGSAPHQSTFTQPDYASVHQELRRKGNHPNEQDDKGDEQTKDDSDPNPKLLTSLARMQPLCIDELGYLNLKTEQVNALFRLMDQRYPPWVNIGSAGWVNIQSARTI